MMNLCFIFSKSTDSDVSDNKWASEGSGEWEWVSDERVRVEENHRLKFSLSEFMIYFIYFFK